MSEYATGAALTFDIRSPADAYLREGRPSKMMTSCFAYPSHRIYPKASARLIAVDGSSLSYVPLGDSGPYSFSLPKDDCEFVMQLRAHP